MVRVLMLAALFVVAGASGAYADEDNFNETAYQDGENPGSDTANCNSAIVLYCDPADGVPGPGFGLGAALGIAAGGFYVNRRRRSGA